eukprot:gene3742-13801_t
MVTFNPDEAGTTTCGSFTPRFDIATASVIGSLTAVSSTALSSASASSSLADMVDKFPEIDDYLEAEDTDIAAAWVALVNAMDSNRAVQVTRLQAVYTLLTGADGSKLGTITTQSSLSADIMNANEANIQASISPELQAAVVATRLLHFEPRSTKAIAVAIKP